MHLMQAHMLLQISILQDSLWTIDCTSIHCLAYCFPRKVVWLVAGKRKRQDPGTGTSDCGTPNLSRLQLPSTRRTASKLGTQSVPCSRVHPKTTGKQASKAAEQALVTTSSLRKGTRAAKQPQSGQNTRLAAGTSTAGVPGDAASAGQAAQEQISATSVPDSDDDDDDDMPDALADVGAGVEADATLQPAAGTGKGAGASSSGQEQARMPSAMPVLLPGGSSRFSTRRLQQKVDAKLPVSKATPLGLPPTPLMPSVPQ